MVRLSEAREVASRPRAGRWFHGISLDPAPNGREEDGAWYYCVAPLSDPGVRRVIRELGRELREAGALEKLDGADREEFQQRLVYAACLVDIEGLQEDDGEEIDLTPRRAFDLVAGEFPELEQDLSILVHRVSGVGARAEAAEEGN